MATAIEYLKAAAGEVSLFSSVGRWMQAVSALIDAGVSSGVLSAPPDFMIAKRAGSDQTFVGANTNISFNALGSSRGISYNGVSAILTPGKTYRLTASFGASTFSSGATGSLTIKFVDQTDTPIQSGIDTPQATLVPPDSTGGMMADPIMDMIFAVPLNATDQQRSVKMRCTSATGNASILQGVGSWVIVEIPGGLP